MVDAECTLSLTMNLIIRIHLAAILVLLLTAGSAAHGQQEPLDGLQPVDQRVADRGALSTSLLWVQYGLNQPYDFNDLYKLPVGTESYVRRNSGLWAVFPDSMYLNTEEGISTAVPAGTVFYIGGARDVLPQIQRNQGPYQSTDAVPANRVIESRIEAILLDKRIPASSIMAEMSNGRGPVDISVDPASTSAPASSSIRADWVDVMPAFSFLHDDAYRRQTIMKVMLQAAGSTPSVRQPDLQSVPEQSSIQMQQVMKIIDTQQPSDVAVDESTVPSP